MAEHWPQIRCNQYCLEAYRIAPFSKGGQSFLSTTLFIKAGNSITWSCQSHFKTMALGSALILLLISLTTQEISFLENPFFLLTTNGETPWFQMTGGNPCFTLRYRHIENRLTTVILAPDDDQGICYAEGCDAFPRRYSMNPVRSNPRSICGFQAWASIFSLGLSVPAFW